MGKKTIKLKTKIIRWARELGFAKAAISGNDIAGFRRAYKDKAGAGFFAGMEYMHRNINKKFNPGELFAGTKSIISVALNYYPNDAYDSSVDNGKACISRYALGRDYHKVMKQLLSKLVVRIKQGNDNINCRIFCDSAPVPELSIAAQAGIGWVGKNSCIISRDNGSWFFLGEIYTDFELEADEKASSHCGSCVRCMDKCPTGAIVRPYTVDARRCISYLTIEHRGAIPENLRTLTGNRIYGCDDCQLVCPWNRFAKYSLCADFSPRHNLDNISLLELWSWNEDEFYLKFSGSPIRRIGYERWLRNLAVALGNEPPSPLIARALQGKKTSSPLVREHITWALEQHGFV